jgi:transposase
LYNYLIGRRRELWYTETKTHSQKFKDSILKKGMNGNRTLISLCSEYGISASSYYLWLKQKKNKGRKEKRPQEWTTAERLKAIKETAKMSSTEKSAWCRKNGVYTHQIENWEQEIVSHKGKKVKTEEAKKIKWENKKLKLENKKLKADLRRKEKALAETAALYVLKKKVEEYLSEEEEEQ